MQTGTVIATSSIFEPQLFSIIFSYTVKWQCC